LRHRLKDFPIHQLTAANRRTVLNDSIKEVFDAKSAEINRGLFDTYFNNYNSAISSVFGDRDDETVQRLRQNVARMAAAKAARVTAYLDRLRADRDGVVREWKEYKPLADRLIKTYNRHQVTEHDAVIHRARTAEQFERFKKDAAIFPNLKWLMTVSAIPRELHLTFVDLVLPIDHPFWVENQPGNLWGCGCDWIQTRDEVSLDIPNGAKPDPGLEGNPAETGEIFTDAHPYLDGTPPHIRDNGPLLAPDDVAYLNRSAEGLDFKLHVNALKEFERENEAYLSAIRAAGYNDVRFLPTQVPLSEPDLRLRYFKQFADSGKNADVLANGDFLELKTVQDSGAKKTRRNIINSIGDASKKADAVIVSLKRPFSERELDQIARQRFKTLPGLKRIIFEQNGTIYDYKRTI
jgi:hypothetical protein